MLILPLSTRILQTILKFIPCVALTSATLIDEFFLNSFPLLVAQSTLFYWTIYRPDLLPFSALFLISLMADGLAGGHFGKTFFMFLLTFFITLSQRRSLLHASFSVIWVAFGFYMLCFAFISYLLDWILLGQSTFQPYMWYTYLGTLLAHPIVFYSLARIKRMLEQA